MELSCSITPLGDSAVSLQIDNEKSEQTQKIIQTITAFLDEHPPVWMIEYIPSFQTLAIFYDPMKLPIPLTQMVLPYEYVYNELESLIVKLRVGESIQRHVIEIPVCYEENFAPDLPFVADYNGLTTEEVIKIHSSGEYLVHMIGFSPGFPYLGGMSTKIASPRKQTPRLKIPARSVGIAGTQTGIYPIETPGGWQLIGRTPINLFRPNHPVPSLLRAGDRIKFKAISMDEYLELEETT